MSIDVKIITYKIINCYLRKIANLKKDNKAATILEFALLSPIFFGLILEVLQWGLYFYVSSEIDLVTNAAARQILTGAIGNQNMNAAQFRANVLCPGLPAGFDSTTCPATIIVNLVNLPVAPSPAGFSTFVNATKTALIRPTMNNASTSFCPGFTSDANQNNRPASVEVLQVYYPMPVISLYWANALAVNVNGKLLYYVGAVAAFRNEPYVAATQTGGC